MKGQRHVGRALSDLFGAPALFAAALVAVGCGGKATAAGASNALCSSSFSCPDGERCDHGRCVADEGCPASFPPVLLYEDAEAQLSPYFGSVKIVGDSIYASNTNPDDLEDVGTAIRTRFIDLRTGAVSYWEHPAGMAGCDGDMTSCLAGRTYWTGLTLDPTSAKWTATNVYENVVPFGYSTLGGASLLGDLRTLIWGERVEILDVRTGSVRPIPWEDGFGLSTIWGDPETGYRLVLEKGGMGSLDFVFVEAREDADVQSLGTYHGPWKMLRSPFPVGNDWYLIHDGLDEQTEVELMHAENGGFEPVAQTSDPMVTSAFFAADYPHSRVGETSVRTLSCTDDRCETGLVDFSTGAVHRLGNVSIEGTNLGPARQRWLACNTVEAIVVVAAVEGEAPTPLRYYLVRVAPSDSAETLP